MAQVCVRCGSSEEPPSINGVCMREGHDYGQQAEPGSDIEEVRQAGISVVGMVWDEVRRVEAERDRYKQALEEIVAVTAGPFGAPDASRIARVALAGGELP